ncbi:MAG: alpha-glucosidase C-terminal domain-containing protein, partial [Bacteroidota bacterium]
TGNKRVYAFSRSKGDNTVVVFTNFDAAKAEVTFSGAPAGDYVNHFTGEPLSLVAGGTLSLPANGFLVLTKK